MDLRRTPHGGRAVASLWLGMKHNKGFQDYYRLPDDDDEESNQIQARFQRLARKVRNESDDARAKFARFASRQEEPVFAQGEQVLLPVMSVPD